MKYKLLTILINVINWVSFKEKNILKPYGVFVYYLMLFLSVISMLFLVYIQ